MRIKMIEKLQFRSKKKYDKINAYAPEIVSIKLYYVETKMK